MQSTNKPFTRPGRPLGAWTPADERRVKQKIKRLRQTGWAGVRQTPFRGR